MFSSSHHDEAVKQILATYSTLKFSPPPSQWTILASIFLTNTTAQVSNVKIISIATGTKCLPTSRYPLHGEALHDSHAEILARRGAVRWVLDEIIRETEGGYPKSKWISRQPEDGKYALKDGGKLCLYVSTVPCGDASTRYLAAFQDPEMAALKDSQHTAASTSTSSSSISTHARGRNNYSLYSVLRTKPGRADSPPTLCMSCSDKLAMWNVLGIQGALGAEVMKPLYFDEVIVGEVAGDEMRKMVKEDCERAFWGRLDVDRDGARGGFAKEVESLSRHYHLHKPAIYFTDIPFIHSRAFMSEADVMVTGSCNESLSWIADSNFAATSTSLTLSGSGSDDRPKSKYDVLINGYKRGVSPKHRLRDKSLPLLCKLSMFRLYHRVLNLLEPEPLDEVNDHENRASLSLSLVRACVALDVDVGVNTGLRQDDGIFGATEARSSGEIDGDGHPEANAEPLTQASVQADSNPDPDANETATHKTHTSTHTTAMHTKPAWYHQEQVDLTRTLTRSKTMAKTYFETKHPQLSIYPPPSLSLSLSSPSLSPSPAPSPLQSSSHSSSPHSPHHHLPLSSSSSSSSSHPEPESILIPNAHTIYPYSSSSIAEYQRIKSLVVGPQGPFRGWIKSGER